MKALLGAVAVLAAVPALAQQPAAPQAWPACEVRGGDTLNNANTSTTRQMRLRAGSTCAMTATGSPGGREVVNAPRNGSVAIEGGRATYRPNVGFIGTDSFVLRERVPGATAPWFTTVNVEVR